MSSDDSANGRDRRDRAALRAARQAGRRRPVRQRQFDNSVPSPCLAICQIDNATDLCIGCRRSIDEIRDWPIMTAEQKKEVLERLAERRAADAKRQAGGT